MGKEKKQNKGWKPGKGWVAGLLVGVLLVLIVGVQWVSGSESGTDEGADYTVYEVYEEAPVLFDGRVQALDIQEVYLDGGSEELVELYVTNGQTVEPGTELLTYQNEEAQRQLDDQRRQRERLVSRRSALETDRANAVNGRDRAEREGNQYKEDSALEGEAVGRFESELSSYEMEIAEAEMEISQIDQADQDLLEQLEDLDFSINRLSDQAKVTEKAVISGQVHVNPGGTEDGQGTGAPYLSIVSEDVEIEASVSEYDFEKIKKGEKVHISLTNSDREMEGAITYVSSIPAQVSGENETARYLFTVSPDEPIQYGFSVEIAFYEGLIYLPASTVISEEEGTYVYVYNDGTAERRPVEVESEGNMYLLKEGLMSGEEVLEEPEDTLSDGDEVSVRYD
ncbi:periplasmic component of efflux system [Alkalibacterium sp. AK22]|uniref:efflux RND transporter periplasmic adaptor subunit n=1 Tax=Alkalibacterium sp. AK22 TaxID=1229520 RepID=UPI00044B1ECB|nr:HlyD family efflux transporter periplasmic adaptor subunit [Alkalibacterium sp. AK22]EXJ23932.1 periplasmic component of efflux system [Alkalibacterium sp. AK22]